MSDAAEDGGTLPKLLAGSRRWLLALLVLTGLGQAGAAGGTVLALRHGLRARTTSGELVAVAVLFAASGCVGWLRYKERLVSEQLGQNYAHEIRLGLVSQVLNGHATASLGTTLTRASNDLTSVRNWVAMGVAPLAVGVPLLLGCTVVLALMNPILAVAVLLPLCALAIVLWVGSRRAFEQARRLRRERGRLAGHLADTLTATQAIRSAGGSDRELRRLQGRSAKVVGAAVARARVLGQIRGAAAAAHGAAMAAVVAASMIGGLSGAELAGALTVVGLLSAQVESLGRVVEYRQTFRAAERVLLPALAGASDPHDTEENREPTPAPARTAHDPAGLVVEHLRVGDHPDVEIPPLYAQAGDRVVVLADDRAHGSVVLDTLVGLRRPVSGSVWVGGRDLESTTPRQRRKLLGYAAQGMRLERSSVARAVSYRRPDSSREKVAEQLSRVGLSERVATLSGGEQSLLRQGGEPLTPPDRARLFLARALLDDPPLLVLDHLDDELGERGRTHVHDLLVDYPGIVLIASESPEAVVTPTQEWHVS